MGFLCPNWGKLFSDLVIVKYGKEYVGKVLNFYNKHSVAEVKLESSGLKIGDEIYVQGNTTGLFSQKVVSLEVDHKKVGTCRKGSSVAVLLEKKARKGDMVFKILKNKWLYFLVFISL